MNRLLLILLLIGIGLYIYTVLYRENNYFTNYLQSFNTQQIQKPELINDEFIEQNKPKERSKVHFSDKNEEFIIPNNEQIKQENWKNNMNNNMKNDMNNDINNDINNIIQPKQDNLYNDIFIVDPIEIKNTNLTLSENEYFNNM